MRPLLLLALAAACASGPPPPGTVACSEITVVPRPSPLSRDETLCVLRNHKEEIIRCSEQQSAADPTLQGMATVALVVLPSGRTSSVTVTPPRMAEAPLGECLVKTVSTWTFPAFTGRAMPVDFPVPAQRSK